MIPSALIVGIASGLLLASPATAQRGVIVSPPSWTAGTADGPLSFGEITDVVLLGGSRVAVLDRASSTLWLLDESGRLLFRVGTSGQGPGEFRWPVAADVLGDRLLVLDQEAGRIAVFQASADSLRHVNDWMLPGLFHDLCVVGERVFVLGFFQGRAVHEVSPDGRIVRSFDPVPPAERTDFLAREEQGFFASGRLVCDALSRTVIVAPTMRRTVRAFDLEGGSRWNSDLPDFHEARLVPRGTAYGMAPDARTGRVTQTETASIGEDGLLVQVRELNPQGGQEAGALSSWSLNLQDGTASPLPRLPLIRLVAPGWVLAAMDGLFPRIQAWRRPRDW